MSAMPDRWIRDRSLQDGMISPFVDRQVSQGVVSYGLSSYGYDLRVADEWKVCRKSGNKILDPKSDSSELFESSQASSITIPPGTFALGRTVERLKIPRDVITICLGKSTYARLGVVVHVTPFEPGWEGYATLEISNTSPVPVRVYANEGICQVVFFSGEQCEVDYASRYGRYQGQPARVVLPFVRSS